MVSKSIIEIKDAEKKALESVETAKKDAEKIKDKIKDEILQIKKTTDENVLKAIELIVNEVQKGE